MSTPEVDVTEFKEGEAVPVMPAKPVNTQIDVPTKEPAKVRLPVSDEDKNTYFTAILSNSPYKEKLVACGGQLNVVFRTRTVQESEEVLKKLNGEVLAKQIDYLADYQNKHLMCHIALAVTEINGINYDHGNLEERVKRIMVLNNQIYLVLIELLNRFDEKMNTLREEALKPNF